MRITKKFAGNNCIGKQVFQPCDSTIENDVAIQSAQGKLDDLEAAFNARLAARHTT